MNEVMSNAVTAALVGAGFSDLTAEVGDDNLCALSGTCTDAEALAQAEAIVAGFELDGIDLGAVELAPEGGGEAAAAELQDAVLASGFEHIEVIFDENAHVIHGVVEDMASHDRLLELVHSYELESVDWQVDVEDQDDEDAEEVAASSAATYTVQKGDSWWRIAKNVTGDGRRWKELKKLNGSPKVIHPGQVLQLPSAQA